MLKVKFAVPDAFDKNKMSEEFEICFNSNDEFINYLIGSPVFILIESVKRLR